MTDENILTVSSKAILDKLVNHEEGEMAYVENEQRYYKYNNSQWVEYTENEKNLKMDLYSLNKQAMTSVPLLQESGYEKLREIITDWHKATHNKFYMLYGKEISYFTVFCEDEMCKTGDSFAQMVTIVLNESFDGMHDYSITEDNSAIEIWVHDNNVGPTILYLFPYDGGIVPYDR